MMMRTLKAALRKEWRDAIRDRRSLIAAFSYAAFGPIVVAFLISMLAEQATTRETATLGLVNGANVPMLEAVLESNLLDIETLEAFDPQAGLPAGVDAVLVLPGDFNERLADFRPATVKLYGNARLDASERAISRAEDAFEEHRRRLAMGRLIERGVSPVILQAYSIESHELSETTDGARGIANMLVLFFILAPFVAGMSIAIDTTAGEREHGALQALLSQPLDRIGLITGKWIVTAAFSTVGAVMTAGLGAVALSFVPLTELDIYFSFDFAMLWQLALIIAPFAGLVAAAQMGVALMARNFKEGQTYLTLLSFMPVAVGFRSTFGDAGEGDSIWPLFAHQDLVEAVLLGEGLNNGQLAITSAVTLAGIALFLGLSAHLLGRERMITEG